MSQEQDQEFFRNYALIISILALMALCFFTIARHLGDEQDDNIQQRASEVAKRTTPVGQVNVAGKAAPAGSKATASASAKLTPKHIFDTTCFACHGNEQGVGGIPAAPHFGDKKAWAPRIAQGKSVLYKHALHGLTGKNGATMPPKGGNAKLTDAEVKATVDFIVSHSQ